MHLRAARDLYPDHAPPLLSLHRSWMLGQALLFEHPDLALIYLLDAQSGFEEAAHLQLAGQDPVFERSHHGGVQPVADRGFLLCHHAVKPPSTTVLEPVM